MTLNSIGTKTIDIIKRVNNRDIGNTCFREILLTSGKIGFDKNSKKPDKTYLIRSLRLTENDQNVSLFCLFSPKYLKGIAFRLEEFRGKINPLIIHITFPYGLNLIRHVDSKKRIDNLIGTVMTYNDLKTWIYEEEVQFNIISEEEWNKCFCYKVESLVVGKNNFSNYERQIFWIDKRNAIIHRIDHYLKESYPIKSIYFLNYHFVDKILLPGTISIRNFKENRELIIQLRNAWFNKSVDSKYFDIPSLKKCKRYLEIF